MPTRRNVLLYTAAMVGAKSALPAFAQNSVVSKRPNILLLIADDWGRFGAQAFDELGAHMPTMKRLREGGVSFSNAFVTAPSCTPSRASILTGKLPWQLEEGANLQGTLPSKFATYTELLEQGGYHAGFMEKGWGPGKLEPGGRTRNPAGNKFSSLDAFLSGRPEHTPFCFWYGAFKPHRPFEAGIGAKHGIDAASITVPAFLPDTPAVRSDLADFRYYLEQFDREAGLLLDELERRGELENTFVVLTGDNGPPFPRAKANLYDAGCHVPLVVMFQRHVPSGVKSDAMVSLVDLAATFLELARLPQPPDLESRSLMPLLKGGSADRTFVLAGRERHLDGREVAGQGYPSRSLRTSRYLLIRNFRPDRWPAGAPPRRAVDRRVLDSDVYSAFADIDKGATKTELVLRGDEPVFKRALALATAKRPVLELYDVKADPYQLVNLAAKSRFGPLLKRLDRLLSEELKRTNDPLILGNTDIFDSYPSYADPGFGRPANF